MTSSDKESCRMRFTVITPNFNGEAYLEKAVRSVLAQRLSGVELEYILVDGGSTDRSMEIVDRYALQIDRIISEPDSGPAAAINKGLAMATGDILSWLNADDFYFPHALKRAGAVMAKYPDAPFCFGACPIIDGEEQEIRRAITRFKEAFFPLSSRFTLQCLNYVSQPAMFFRRSAQEKAGMLREDWTAAWDYDFLLRLWRQGRAVRVRGTPLAAFRWHEGSIGGRSFFIQFKEELDAVVQDAGPSAPQTLIHHGVRWGIVGIYLLMAWLRKRKGV